MCIKLGLQKAIQYVLDVNYNITHSKNLSNLCIETELIVESYPKCSLYKERVFCIHVSVCFPSPLNLPLTDLYKKKRRFREYMNVVDCVIANYNI